MAQGFLAFFDCEKCFQVNIQVNKSAILHEGPTMARPKSTASQLLKLYSGRVDPHEAAQRFAERDQRQAADTRTPAQVWLNDPAPGRSALAQGSQPVPRRTSSKGFRPDLWRK
jgi:hypothetical protein